MRIAPRLILVGALGLAPLLLDPTAAHAHAFAQRYDLPLPLWLYLVGAGAAVALSFVAMAVFVRFDPAPGRVPSVDLLRFRLGRAVAHRGVVAVVRVLAVALFVLLLSAGFFGRQDNAFANILPTMIWVIWWVGIAFVSALVGNIWALINPWQIIADWVVALHRRGRAGRAAAAAPPPPMGGEVWPAVVLFAAFAWAELVWSARGVPASLAFAIAVYSAVTWVGMGLWGRAAWLRRGEAFAVLFGLFARFAPLQAQAGGTAGAPRRWDLQPYAVGLITRAPVPVSLLVFIILVLSTVTFDGFAETFAWQDLTALALAVPAIATTALVLGFSNPTNLLMTVALIVVPLAFLAVYLAVSWLMATVAAAGSDRGRAAAREPGALGPSALGPSVLGPSVLGPSVLGPSAIVVARHFITSLIPIAIAYHLAHFLSLLLIFGQLIIPLASDPFGFGWDLFGTADYQINIAIVDARFVWFASVAAIVIGHVAAVYVAHVVALGVYADRRVALRSQYPMLVLMVGYTIASLWILAQPLVSG